MKEKEKLSFSLFFLVFIVAILSHSFLSENNVLFKNYVLSFSLNSSNVLLLNIVFIFCLGFLFFKNRTRSLGLILIGGLVNLSDRLFLGYVRDYWTFGSLVNNMADWLIGIGLLLFLIEIIWKKKKK